MSNERRLTDLEVLTSEIIAEQKQQSQRFDLLRVGFKETRQHVATMLRHFDQVLVRIDAYAVNNQRLNSLFLDLLEVLRRQDDAQDEVRYTLADHEQRLHKLEEPGTDEYANG